MHFNYPKNVFRQYPDNNIIFGGFKSLVDTPIALVDTKYNTWYSDGTICFNMNHWISPTVNDSTDRTYNYGGWKGCDLRYDILGATSTPPNTYGSYNHEDRTGYNATTATIKTPVTDTLMAALPSNFRAVLKLWSRWIDAHGGGSTTAENIEETIDAISILAEFEVQGTCSWSNPNEANYQIQMAYYQQGYSFLRSKHSLDTITATHCAWQLASPSCNNSFLTSFTYVSEDGDISRKVNTADHVIGLALIFKV